MELTEEEFEKYKLEPGDFLVNRVNSRKLVGKAAPVPEGLEPCVYESKNIRVRLKGNIEPRYLQYWFSLYRRRYFTNILQQTVGQASITQKQLRNMPLPIPPIEEQSEIVRRVESRFSVVDEVKKEIEENETRAQNLRRAVLRDAFSGKLTHEGDEREDIAPSSPNSSEDRVQKKLHEIEGETDD
jgi:type I restriction enzyme S subunit